jgi:hypothetical protein
VLVVIVCGCNTHGRSRYGAVVSPWSTVSVSVLARTKSLGLRTFCCTGHGFFRFVNDDKGKTHKRRTCLAHRMDGVVLGSDTASLIWLSQCQPLCKRLYA